MEMRMEAEAMEVDSDTDQRTTFLFDGVISENPDIKDAKKLGSKSMCITYLKYLQVFPILMNKARHDKELAALLPTLRLVCKTWKQTVDNTLESISPVEFTESGIDEIRKELKFGTFLFTKGQDQRKVEKVVKDAINPFPGRYISYSEQRTSQRQSLRNSFQIFLKQFWSHVYNLKVLFPSLSGKTTDCNWAQEGTFWWHLQKWMQLLPNLQFLWLDFGGAFSKTPVKMMECLQDEALNNLPAFPKVVAMVSLVVTSGSSPKGNLIIDPVLSTIIAANPQLGVVKINGIAVDVHSSWNNLMELDMPELKVSSDMKNNCVEWKLDKMRIRECIRIQSWDRLASTLALFSNLTELELAFGPYFGCEVPEKTLRFEIPKLKKLSMVMITYVNHFDFLLGIQNLEFLKIDMQRMWASDEHLWRLNGVLNYLYNPRKSNIWTYLKRLQRMEIRSDRGWTEQMRLPYFNPRGNWLTCTRQEAESLQKSIQPQQRQQDPDS